MYANVMEGWWDTHVYAGINQGREDDAPEYHGYFVTYL